MTTITEAQIQSGLQTAIQAMDEFADADVVINDWGVLDKSSSNAPYVIITSADVFDSMQDTVSPQNTWDIQAALVERFTTWKATLDNLTTRRQAIIDKINTTNVRTAGGLTGVNIRRVRNRSDIEPYYDPYVQDIGEAIPIYLIQTIVLETETFT